MFKFWLLKQIHSQFRPLPMKPQQLKGGAKSWRCYNTVRMLVAAENKSEKMATSFEIDMDDRSEMTYGNSGRHYKIEPHDWESEIQSERSVPMHELSIDVEDRQSFEDDCAKGGAEEVNSKPHIHTSTLALLNGEQKHHGPQTVLSVSNDLEQHHQQHPDHDSVTVQQPRPSLIPRLASKFIFYLGAAWRWFSIFVGLSFYAFLLLPGFIQVGYFYYFSKRVRRGIVYGDQHRNKLDLYLSEKMDQSKPVVIFVTGGAWIIGYKAWGALLGRQLADRNMVVACLDYRNYPEATVGNMVLDVSTGIQFVLENLATYGGDSQRVFLLGQSAGSHISACALVKQAEKEVAPGGTVLPWRASNFKAFMSISGGFNLINLVDHLNQRGLYRSLFLKIMEGEESLPSFSPELIVQSPSFQPLVHLLPPAILFHGTADYSIPCHNSETYAEALHSIGGRATVHLYPDKTHTDLFLQDLMRGGQIKMILDILEVIHEDDGDAQAEDRNAPPARRLVPECLLQLARKISPF